MASSIREEMFTLDNVFSRDTGCYVITLLVAMLSRHWLLCYHVTGCYVITLLVAMLSRHWLLCYHVTGCYVITLLVAMLSRNWL